MGPLEAWIWLANERFGVFRETQDERSSRQLLTAFNVHIALPNDLRYFKGPYSPKTAKEPKSTMTLAEQVNIVNKRIKTTDHIHVFATK